MMRSHVPRRKCLKVIISIIIIQIVIILVLLYQEKETLHDVDETELKPVPEIITKRTSPKGEFRVFPDTVIQEKIKVNVIWTSRKRKEKATFQMSPEDLLEAMGTIYHWKWIKSRILNLWPDWIDAVDSFSAKENMQNRTQLQILVAPGLLTQTNFAQIDSIRQGGPLGELVQWADLITALSLLGHNVTLQHNVRKAIAMLSYVATSKDDAAGCLLEGPDLIFTDYNGLSIMSESALNAFRHKFRVLDIYGTEAPYNNPKMASSEGHDVTAAFDLHLQQFYTLYPGSPDNSFLGFVVRPHEIQTSEKRNVAVVYGKEAKHIVHCAPMLRALSGSFELHATTTRSAYLPHFIINHGVLPPTDYAAILQSAKVMVGVGHPVEGPGALEAISKGLIFLNPSFARGENPLQHKPTTRKLTSQVPYAEKYIGPPNVITLDVKDLGAVLDAIPLLNKTVEPVLPFEFSMEGYLQRLNYFLTYQNFCSKTQDVELDQSLKVKESKPGKDCIETCDDQGLICERSLFSRINDKSFYQSNVPACKEFFTEDGNYIYPSLHATTGICYLQSNSKLFSCAGRHTGHIRLCPCRSYRKHQIALCETCR